MNDKFSFGIELEFDIGQKYFRYTETIFSVLNEIGPLDNLM